MASFINSVRNKRSVSPVVERLLELSVVYQQFAQNNQNNPTTSSGNLSELNKQIEKKIRTLVKQLNKSKRNGTVDELEKAILHKDSRTKCITVPRLVDRKIEREKESLFFFILEHLNMNNRDRIPQLNTVESGVGLIYPIKTN